MKREGETKTLIPGPEPRSRSSRADRPSFADAGRPRLGSKAGDYAFEIGATPSISPEMTGGATDAALPTDSGKAVRGLRKAWPRRPSVIHAPPTELYRQPIALPRALSD